MVVPSYLLVVGCVPVVDVGDTLPLVPVGGSLVFCGTGCSRISPTIGVPEIYIFSIYTLNDLVNSSNLG